MSQSIVQGFKEEPAGDEDDGSAWGLAAGHRGKGETIAAEESGEAEVKDGQPVGSKADGKV